jgi:hypothetical protein
MGYQVNVSKKYKLEAFKRAKQEDLTYQGSREWSEVILNKL